MRVSSRKFSEFAEALLGMEVGHELIVITWLHEAKRNMLKNIRNNESRAIRESRIAGTGAGNWDFIFRRHLVLYVIHV